MKWNPAALKPKGVCIQQPGWIRRKSVGQTGALSLRILSLSSPHSVFFPIYSVLIQVLIFFLISSLGTVSVSVWWNCRENVGRLVLVVFLCLIKTVSSAQPVGTTPAISSPDTQEHAHDEIGRGRDRNGCLIHEIGRGNKKSRFSWLWGLLAVLSWRHVWPMPL